jgi:multidrug efflux pump subunit AcrA (membrane-fusion protein)
LLGSPGQPDARLSLTTSFVARARPNLAAFASVSSDPDYYGTIRVLQLPCNAVINGPGQVANLFLSTREVAEAVTVRLRMANDEIFAHPGAVQTIEADFNSETGTIAFRAGFPNPEGLLRHGETGEILMATRLPGARFVTVEAQADRAAAICSPPRCGRRWRSFWTRRPGA